MSAVRRGVPSVRTEDAPPSLDQESPACTPDARIWEVDYADGTHLRYQARTATGRLYDDFEITRAADGRKTLREIRQGRIGLRDCSHRDATLGGRTDRCWE